MSIELEARVRRLGERMDAAEQLDLQVEEIERLIAELQDAVARLGERTDKLEEWAPQLVHSIAETDAERQRDIDAIRLSLAEAMQKRKPGRPRKDATAR